MSSLATRNARNISTTSRAARWCGVNSSSSLSRATAIYANSRFTQKIIEDGFGVRCPVLYAVPRERA